jgi:acyl-CoA thioester hydrolase
VNDKNLSAEIVCDVEFYDVDPMDMVWHGNYIKYFERVRRALLDKIGCGYREMQELGYAFPITSLSLKYIKPFRFADRIVARAYLEEYETCLRIRYELYDERTGALHVKGASDQMAVNRATGESCFVCPSVLVNKIKPVL